MPGVLPTGIAQTIAQPPISATRPILDEAGPYGTGDHNLTTFLTTTAHGLLPAGTWPIGGTYGVIVVPNGAIPTSWGVRIGYDSGGALGQEGYQYDNRFAQLVLLHAAIGGFLVPVIYRDCLHLQEYVAWDLVILAGDQLGVHVSPGVAVDLYYMCLLA